jgi:tetratricopeptide (TPR) repeat protein
MNDQARYHHGQVIRTFRQKAGLTIAALAEQWPSGPVSWRYVQRVETGEKQIADQQTLRSLSKILDIPLWHFGLSEYNPFQSADLPGHGERLFTETMNMIDQMIDQTWFMRRVAPAPETEKSIRRLLSLFEHFMKHLLPPSQLEKHFLRSFAQVQRLRAIMLIERRQYPKALRTFEIMQQIAQQLDEPATLALAHMGIGTELERAGRVQEAIDQLEAARDLSFRCNRQVAAIVNAYLARAYASDRDDAHFQRSIDTAQSIAEGLGDHYGDGTDHIHHRLSGILAERSYGYLQIGQPQKTLEMRDTIMGQIEINQNTWLYAWMPLDWARAHLALGNIEASVTAGHEFLHRAEILQSPHATHQALVLLQEIEREGHGKEMIVQAFRNELEMQP